MAGKADGCFQSSFLSTCITSALAEEYPTVLDVGCGSGKLAARLASHGFVIRGVDVKEDPITYGKCECTHTLQLEHGAAESILARPFPESNVLFCLSLHHMNVDRVLALARRSIRVGGRIVVVDICATGKKTVSSYCISQLGQSLVDGVHSIIGGNWQRALRCLRAFKSQWRFFLSRDGQAHISNDLISNVPLTEEAWRRVLGQSLPGGSFNIIAGPLFIHVWEK